MSQVNNDKHVDLNVDNYSPSELFEILNVSTPNVKSIKAASSKLIKKFTDEGNTDLANFFEEAQERLLEAIPKPNDMDLVNFDNKFNSQNQDAKQLDRWWAEQALVQSDENQADRNTERKQRIGLFDNIHNVMGRERLGINQSYDLPVAQGQMNPNLKNVNTRLVNIDSQFRQNSYPAKSGLLFSQIVTPHTSTYSSTDFTVDLTDTLNNVLSLKLYSVTIPYSWYNIDSTNGNSCFILICSGNPYKIVIPSGNYLADSENDENNIFSVINSTIMENNNPVSECIEFSYDILTGKTKIKANVDVEIIWYSPSDEIQQKYPACDSTCGIGSKANSNLGFTLGFRDIQTTIESSKSVLSDSVINLYGPRYLLLVVDDYNQNHLNKGLVSIQDTETVASMPSYYDPNLPCVVEEPDPAQGTYNSWNRFGIANEPADLQNPNVVPKRLTNAQQATINGISKDRANASQNKLRSVTNSDMFALIPIKKSITTSPGEGLTEFSGPIQVNERVYFGPVDIDRLRIRLLTDKGEPLNLNGNDWSFCMIAETLYQY